jgi:hypothetical protein
LLGSRSKQPIEVALGRFGEGGSGVRLGKLSSGEWASVELPADSAPDRWWVVLDGPAYVCPLAAG